MMSWVEYYEIAAIEAQWNFKLWLRYLNKSIQRDKINLSDKDIETILNSDKLQDWQRYFLKQAVKVNTLPWKMTVEYSEPADFWRLREYIKKRALK